MKRIRTYPADHDQHSAVTADVRVPMRNVLTITTLLHEREAYQFDRLRARGLNWRIVCRQRISHLSFLTDRHWLAVF